MKNTKIAYLFMTGVAVALSGCSDNAWNDKLDGFDGELPITEVQSIQYTLTAVNYDSIANNLTNKLMAGEAADALKAIGTQHYFTDAAPASKFVPAFLSSIAFPYFTLDNGSAVKLTYNVWNGVPAEVTALANASEYIISDTDYQLAWKSDEEYIGAFTPSVSPTRNIPTILGDVYDDAEAGDYVIVNYEYSDQEPIFASIGGGDEPEEFAMSSVIGTIALGQTVDINGMVTAKSTNGMIITDLSGSVFMYYGNSFDYNAYNIGDQVVVSAEVSSYNKGFQLTGSSAEVEVVGNAPYTYPTPVIYDGASLDVAITRTDNALAQYAQLSGTVSVNGNNINIIVPGAEKAQGGAYYAPDDIKALLVDGTDVTMTGYFIAIAGSRYCNFVVTAVTAGAITYKAPVVPVKTTNTNAVYTYNGTKWAPASDVIVLQAADYTAMGQNYGNLSNELPAQLLPIYLSKNYPYAQADQAYFVVYKYYSSAGTSYRCDQYVYNGSEWTLNNGITTETAQFVKSNGKWNYDPSVTITLPSGRGIAISTTYYQACVDWVYENVDRKLGSTSITSGKYYITSYGNNEYYSGTSAYQGDLDLRAAKALEQYPEGYQGMTDDQIVELMMQRFAYQVMPGALSAVHPDAVPVDGIEVIYTINFVAYTGTNVDYTIRYKVTAPATFEFIDCTWWEGGVPAERLPLN